MCRSIKTSPEHYFEMKVIRLFELVSRERVPAFPLPITQNFVGTPLPEFFVVVVVVVFLFPYRTLIIEIINIEKNHERAAVCPEILLKKS